MQKSSFENYSFLALGLRRKPKQNPHSTLDCLFSVILATTDDEVAKLEKFSCFSANATEIDKYSKIISSSTPTYGSETNKIALLEALKGKNKNEKSFAASNNLLENYSTTDAVIAVLPSISKPISCAEEAYLKLHLLSTLLLRPHQANLENLFPNLQTICWTNYGPILAKDMDSFRTQINLQGTTLNISHIDKIPFLTNYITPKEVRIADSSRARLGAYLSPGTTVMPAGYVNFNAGTLGNAMVEGRISAGVVIGENSDVGGGASIMGTLSGGGKEVITIGANCLLGANAGSGISLGFGCTIAAGTYVTASAKVYTYDNKLNPIDVSGSICKEGNNICYARELSGKEKLLFFQDTRSGKLIAKPNPHTIELNPALHAN